jgi:hypothetical protein
VVEEPIQVDVAFQLRFECLDGDAAHRRLKGIEIDPVELVCSGGY